MNYVHTSFNFRDLSIRSSERRTKSARRTQTHLSRHAPITTWNKSHADYTRALRSLIEIYFDSKWRNYTLINPEFLQSGYRRPSSRKSESAPKPGSVDPISVGAHKDMTKETFYQSIEALVPFTRLRRSGSRHNGVPLGLFNELPRPRKTSRRRDDGRNPTNINTHKEPTSPLPPRLRLPLRTAIFQKAHSP